VGYRSRRKERDPSGDDLRSEKKGTFPGEGGAAAYPEKLIPARRNGFRRHREDVFRRRGKGGYLSHEKGDLILNIVAKRPLSGPVDYVALERGDRTATKPVFPADTGKTDHQKDRIILSLLYKFLGRFIGRYRKTLWRHLKRCQGWRQI
jgi:hypothetical protein